MSREIVAVVVATLLGAVAIADASAQCYLPYVVQRPSPTATRLPTRTPYWIDTATPTLTPVWTPTATPPPPTARPTRQPGSLHLRGENVIEAFRQNGLAVDGVTAEHVSESGYTCALFEWAIPQYGTEAKGFLADCTNDAERGVFGSWLDLACFIYPDKCPHQYARANVHVAVRNVVPRDYSDRYGDVLARVE